MRRYIQQINSFLNETMLPASKVILLINVAVFFFFFFVGILYYPLYFRLQLLLCEWPRLALGKLWIWQFLTYMFIHIELTHLLFNMFAFWWIGPVLERRMGRANFLNFYLICGFGAGLLQAWASLTFDSNHGAGTSIVGASGAIVGALLAYACYYPEQTIFLYGLFAMKVKHFVLCMLAAELFFSWSNAHGLMRDNISHITHLTGTLVGYIWMAVHHRDWDWHHWRHSH